MVRDAQTTVSGGLVRDRLALDAAFACLKLEGSNNSVSDFRDAVCLARAGEAFGPACQMFVAWCKLTRINLVVGLTGPKLHIWV
jgi:hypothetical protein